MLTELQQKKTEMDKKKEMYRTVVTLLRLKADAVNAKIKKFSNYEPDDLNENQIYELANLQLEAFNLDVEIAAKEQFVAEYAGRDLQFRQFIEQNIQEINKRYWEVTMDARKICFETKGVPYKKIELINKLLGRFVSGFQGEFGEYERVETWMRLKNEVDEIHEMLKIGHVQVPKVQG
jgi:hypothetical protein